MGEGSKKPGALPAWVAQFNEILKNGTLATAVLNAAIAHSGSSSGADVQVFLQDAWKLLQRWQLPAGGARDARGLKPLTLRKNFQPLREALPNLTYLGVSTSALWVHHHPQLQETARRFAELKGLTIAQPDDKGLHGLAGWPADWDAGQLRALAEELASQQAFAPLGGIAVDAAKLMLFMLCLKPHESQSSNLLISTEQNTEVVPPLSSQPELEPPSSALVSAQITPRELFARMLELLRVLPDEAPEWAELDGFISTYKELDAQRQERRAKRRHLENELAKLAEPEMRKGLSFLSQLAGHERWDAGVLAESDHDTVVGEIRRLWALLAEVSAQLELSPPRNIQESRERNRRLDELSTESERLYQSLSSKLLPATDSTIPEMTATPAIGDAAAKDGENSATILPTSESSAFDRAPKPIGGAKK